MIRPMLSLLLSVWALFAVTAQESQPARSLAELRGQMEEILLAPRFSAAEWGIKVASLDTGKILFEYNPQKLLSPASNSKLYTVALALDRLGADYRIQTSLYSTVRPDRRGTLKGDLILYGRGDPTINARLHGGNILAALEPLVTALTNAGVKRITGDLVADESFFRGPEFGSGWAWDDMQYAYGAEISALTINDNILRVTLRPGSQLNAPCALSLAPAPRYVTLVNRTKTASPETVLSVSVYRLLNENAVHISGELPITTNSYTDAVTVHRPAMLFASLFREALAARGIQVKGCLRAVNWMDRHEAPLDCNGMVELGSVDSLPMTDIAREVQKPSQNLYADLLLAHVGEKSRKTSDKPESSSEELGIGELNKFLAEAGVTEGDVQFEEGSGLSRNNLTTARATVALLQHMSRHPCAEAYKVALPVAGVDGTLRNRMKNTPAAGNAHAKTGSLRWASSLSGYVTTAAGERLVFSFMLNRYHNPGRSSRADLDALTVALARFAARSDQN